MIGASAMYVYPRAIDYKCNVEGTGAG
jgi:hypothetical protein